MPLTLNEYQEKAKETAIYPKIFNSDIESYDYYYCGLDYCLFGLSGEVGELLQIKKRELRGDDIYDENSGFSKMFAEAGDILWYLSQLCSEMGVTLEEIVQYNLDKLADRKERGVIKGTGDNR